MLQILFLSSLISCNRDSIDGGYNIQKLHSTIVSTTTEVNFGNVVVLYDDTKSFQIINAGKADLEITSMALNVNEDESYMITTMPIVVEDADGTGNTDEEVDSEESAESDSENEEGSELSEEQDKRNILTITAEEPLVIEPDESVEVEVYFKPETFLPYNRSLDIESNDPDNPSYSIAILGEGVDGPVPDIAVTPPAIDFGEVAQAVTETKYFEIRNTGSGVLEILDVEIEGSGDFTIITNLNGASYAQEQFSTVIVTYSPTSEGGANARIRLQTNDPDEEFVDMNFLGNGGGDFEFPTASFNCPSQVDPPTTVTFDARSSSDPNGYEPLIYLWSLVNSPNASSTDFDESDLETPQFFVDAAGEYTVQLIVENSIGLASEPTQCTFTGIPDESIQVELSWNTGNSDLDLHFVQYQGEDDYPDTFGFPLFNLNYDCCFCIANPPWGDPGNADDPSLSLDNLVGYGPEVTHINTPVDGTYGVFVHYFDDKGGGLTTATLKVFMDGIEETTQAAPMEEKDFWYVGDINWSNGSGQWVTSNENPARITGIPQFCYNP